MRSAIAILGWAFALLVTSNEAHDELPSVYSLHVVSRIRSRFATTVVTSRIANPKQTSAEAIFVVQLPDPAFITHFSMKIDGKLIVGEVKEKAEAKENFDAAKARGESAGLVSQAPRETNTFRITVNVAKESKIVMELTYQEVLRRTHGAYKHIVNINPGQIVDDLVVDVLVEEKTEITRLLAPEFGEKMGAMTNKELLKLPASSNVRVNSTITANYSHAHFYYHPTTEEQGEKGLKGQMVVLYDVKRGVDGGELLVVNGYFLHFFAPDGLPVASKHVVFVLDKSGSMMGRKMAQTKDAMKVILRDLNKDDHFNIITFSNGVNFWKPSSLSVDDDSIAEAIAFVDSIQAGGGTNINDAMVAALRHLFFPGAPTSLTPAVIFLTDGQATVGERNRDRIVTNVLEANNNGEAVVHSIGFGNDLDFKLLKKMSLLNNGVARKVYEDSDATLQLAGFYAEVSSPLLKNVQIRYLNQTADPESLLIDSKYTVYKGGEVAIVGRVTDAAYTTTKKSMTAEITAEGRSGMMTFHTSCILPPLPCFGRWPCVPLPTTPSPVLRVGTVGGFVERMWAYQTIKRLLEREKYLEEDNEKKKQLKQRALELSLKYKFVTELTSMVVVQQQEKSVVLESVEQGDSEFDSNPPAASSSILGGGRMSFFRPATLLAPFAPLPLMPTASPPPRTTTATMTTAAPPTTNSADPCMGEVNAKPVLLCASTNDTIDRVNWIRRLTDAGLHINGKFKCETTSICGCLPGFVRIDSSVVRGRTTVTSLGCMPLYGKKQPMNDNEEIIAVDDQSQFCEPTCKKPTALGVIPIGKGSAKPDPDCVTGFAYVCKSGMVRNSGGYCMTVDTCP